MTFEEKYQWTKAGTWFMLLVSGILIYLLW